MAKTKFFRVAVSGTTADGREITREHIQQMVDSYSVEISPATINCEHIMGYSPNPPFNSYGLVTALKAEEIELTLFGKTEKRLAMYAQFDINDQAKLTNQAGQKLFSSIQFRPDFAKTGKAYLDGVAFTDNPASLATELLKFSKRGDDRKDMLCAVEEFTLEFEAETTANDEARGALAAFRNFFSSMTQPQQQAPAQPAVSATASEQPAQPDLAAFAAQFSEGMGKMADAMEASAAKTDARFAALKQELDAMRGQIEETPSRNYSRRPTGTGGGDRVKATC